MKEYSYQAFMGGYKVFCNGVCILWAEADKKGKRKPRYSKTEVEGNKRAAEAYINRCKAWDKYEEQEGIKK